jgi:precorrin-3B synthase
VKRDETTVTRTRADTCPGAVVMHSAADGLLARIRIPGGALPGTALAGLAAAAAELGDGSLELTSRANLQLRGLTAASAGDLTGRLRELALLPSLSHERVRNILASPLSGLDGRGHADVQGLVTSLDRALCARPRLARLPGRFLVAIDDGRGDLQACQADVRVTALSGRELHIWPGDVAISVEDAVTVVLALMESFLDERDAQATTSERSAWRIHELVDGAALVAARAMAESSPAHRRLRSPRRSPVPQAIGVIEQCDGRHALAVVPPLGRLDAAQARCLAALCGPRGLRITPWRTVVLTDVTDTDHAMAAAAAAGLGVTGDSPWFGVTSCAGRPGCAKALADVQADARAVVAAGVGVAGGRRVHWSGCERRCGRPAGKVVDVQADGTGYGVHDASGRIRRVADHTNLGKLIEAIRHAKENA